MTSANQENHDMATEPQDASDAQAAHVADRPPTEDEDRLAEQNDIDPAVGDHFRAMADTGAAVKGEGEVE